ncbi:MAG: hypothetical protein K0R25_1212 [Rickettsiaceae bacterium]|jgi:hypothetical protein|nr:hypothetical protein [Rickettsiaceae bacterium]
MVGGLFGQTWKEIMKKTKAVTKTSSKPVLFSDHFGIDKKRLEELGIFNPILNFDTKLFVEPLLLKSSKSEIIRNSIDSYNKFFANILKLLRASKEEGDKMWRAAKGLVYFPEYKSTCIGYGSDSIHGAGAGRGLSDQILKGAKDIIDAAQGDPEIFLLAPLLEKGIGPDLISDMTQRLIDDEICQFTIDAMKKINLVGYHPYKTKSGNIYLLPYNSFSKCPVKLLPLDILSELPLADNFDIWLVDIADRNSELRDSVSLLIGKIWFEATKAEKKEMLLNEIKTNKSFFIEILKILREYSFEHYDIEKDYQGLYRWLENSEQFINLANIKLKNVPQESQESLLSVVEEIVRNFQNLIEKNELWRMFWTKHKSKPRHVRELYSQMLFFMMAKSWLSSNTMDIELIKDTNQEVKQLEFNFIIKNKFSVTVLVKHSNNAQLENGYKKQATLGLKGVKALFVVMNFHEDKSDQFISIIQNQEDYCKIIEIDVINREDNEKDKDGLSQLESDWNLGDLKDWDLFEEVPWDNDYIEEKRKGGQNSYQKYKPLKQKVEELCKEELESGFYKSASNLCEVISHRIESDYPELLENFEPYQVHSDDGGGWTKPTFYGWCNNIFKQFK